MGGGLLIGYIVLLTGRWVYHNLGEVGVGGGLIEGSLRYAVEVTSSYNNRIQNFLILVYN